MLDIVSNTVTTLQWSLASMSEEGIAAAAAAGVDLVASMEPRFNERGRDAVARVREVLKGGFNGASLQ